MRNEDGENITNPHAVVHIFKPSEFRDVAIPKNYQKGDKVKFVESKIDASSLPAPRGALTQPVKYLYGEIARVFTSPEQNQNVLHDVKLIVEEQPRSGYFFGSFGLLVGAVVTVVILESVGVLLVILVYLYFFHGRTGKLEQRYYSKEAGKATDGKLEPAVDTCELIVDITKVCMSNIHHVRLVDFPPEKLRQNVISYMKKHRVSDNSVDEFVRISRNLCDKFPDLLDRLLRVDETAPGGTPDDPAKRKTFFDILDDNNYD